MRFGFGKRRLVCPVSSCGHCNWICEPKFLQTMRQILEKRTIRLSPRCALQRMLRLCTAAEVTLQRARGSGCVSVFPCCIRSMVVLQIFLSAKQFSCHDCAASALGQTASCERFALNANFGSSSNNAGVSSWACLSFKGKVALRGPRPDLFF